MIHPVLFGLQGKPFGTFTLTSTNVAASFAAAKIRVNSVPAIGCYITVATNDIRYCFGGNIPVNDGLGHVLAKDGPPLILMNPAMVSTFQYVSAAAGAHGVMQVTMLFDIGTDFSD